MLLHGVFETVAEAVTGGLHVWSFDNQCHQTCDPTEMKPAITDMLRAGREICFAEYIAGCDVANCLDSNRYDGRYMMIQTDWTAMTFQ